MSTGRMLTENVLKELQPTALVYRGDCMDCFDIPNLVNGIYRVAYSTKNSPTGIQWGLMIVIHGEYQNETAAFLVGINGHCATMGYTDSQGLSGWKIITVTD